MPLMNYFSFVGSALVLLLFGLSWYFPPPVSEPIRNGIDSPVIRISSVEKLPERVNIDTRLPTIVPPPSVMEFAEREPVVKAVETNTDRKPKTPTAGHDALKKQSHVKREPKKVVAHRAAPAMSNEPPPNYREQASPPVTRLSLLDLLKERLGHGLFKLN